MIYSTGLLKQILPYDNTENTIYVQTPKEYGSFGNQYIRGHSCMKFLVAQNSLTTQYIQIWSAQNDDTDNIPPIVSAGAFKQGAEYNIIVSKFKVWADAAGTTPYAVTDATLMLVGYFN